MHAGTTGGPAHPPAPGRTAPGQPWATWLLAVTLLAALGQGACPARGPAPPRGPGPAPAAPPRTPQGIAEHLCRLPPGDLRPFLAPRFQLGTSEARLRRTFLQHRRLHGPCQGVTAGRGPRVTWRHRDAEISGRVYLDRQGRLEGLWFDELHVPGDGWARLLSDLKALPGETALLVREAGRAPLAAQGADRALAVASTAKIFVLKALAQEIQDGRMRWDDVVRFDPARRSFPTAPLNAWPPKGPLTLATLATYMIAHSDNTATDHLIRHVGRALVEQHAGAQNRPFLTTREAFVLKSPGSAALAARYLAADAAGRRALLAKEVAAVPRAAVREIDRPTHVASIEWLFTASALCDAMLALRQLGPFRANPGPAGRRRWRLTAYKGGSEPGVRSVAFALEHRASGRVACLALTWVNPKARLYLPRFDALLRRALALLDAALATRPGPVATRSPHTTP